MSEVPVDAGMGEVTTAPKRTGRSSLQDAAEAAFPNGTYNSIVDETVLRPGGDNPVLRVPRLTRVPAISEQLAKVSVLTEITVRACYCSALDQCWISDLESTRTQPVRQCTATPV